MLKSGQIDQPFHRTFFTIHALILLHIVSWWSNRTNMSPNISPNIWFESCDQKVLVSQRDATEHAQGHIDEKKREYVAKSLSE